MESARIFWSEYVVLFSIFIGMKYIMLCKFLLSINLNVVILFISDEI